MMFQIQDNKGTIATTFTLWILLQELGLWHFVMPKFNMYNDGKDPFDHFVGFK